MRDMVVTMVAATLCAVAIQLTEQRPPAPPPPHPHLAAFDAPDGVRMEVRS